MDAFEETPMYYSPPYLALQWLAHGDGLNIEIPTEPLLEFDERYAMVVLYFSLDGPNWKQQLNFLSNTHICDWHEEVQIVNGVKDRGYGLHRCKQTSTGDLYPFTLSLRTLHIYISSSSFGAYIQHMQIYGYIYIHTYASPHILLPFAFLCFPLLYSLLFGTC